jgi:hypothetical protein
MKLCKKYVILVKTAAISNTPHQSLHYLFSCHTYLCTAEKLLFEPDIWKTSEIMFTGNLH